jgi:hypothetical protein
MCPIKIRYVLRFKTPEDHPRRAVALLDVAEGGSAICEKFDGLRDNEKWRFLNSFQNWCDMINNPKRYHGWDRSEQGGKYIDCFTFKGPGDNRSLRLYGFLCHPKVDDSRFQLCVLTHYAYKNENETDFSELDRVHGTRQLESVPGSIQRALLGS